MAAPQTFPKIRAFIATLDDEAAGYVEWALDLYGAHYNRDDVAFFGAVFLQGQYDDAFDGVDGDDVPEVMRRTKDAVKTALDARVVPVPSVIS